MDPGLCPSGAATTDWVVGPGRMADPALRGRGWDSVGARMTPYRRSAGIHPGRWKEILVKPRHVVLICSLMALGWAWVRRTTPERGATYRFAFDRAAEGVVSVEAALGVSGGPVTLRGMLADAILGMSDFTAIDALGAELPVSLESTTTSGPDGEVRRFTRVIVTPGPSRSVRIRYDVAPGTYLPPAGDNETRQCGRVSAHGCVLSLANLLLLPEGPSARLRLEAVFPAPWTELVSLPRSADSGNRGELWRMRTEAVQTAQQSQSCIDA